MFGLTQYEFVTVAVSGVALVVALLSAIFVFFQVRIQRKQLFLENYTKIVELNREILVIGFDHPELFDVLDGREIKSPQMQQRFLQLWMNQIDVIHFARKYGVIDQRVWISFQNDIGDFFSLQLAREHWRKVRSYYDCDMATFIDGLIENRQLVLHPPIPPRHSWLKRVFLEPLTLKPLRNWVHRVLRQGR